MSVGKILTIQAWALEYKYLGPLHSWNGVHICNPSATAVRWEAESGAALKTQGSGVFHTYTAMDRYLSQPRWKLWTDTRAVISPLLIN